MSANRETRRALAHFGARQHSIRHVSWPTLLLSLCGLLALAVQSFVVQTHIHRLIVNPAASIQILPDGKQSVAAGQQKQAPARSAPADRYPIDGDPANCPICQEIAHAGAVLQSTTISIALAISTCAPIVLFAETTFFSVVVSHGWRGRAPPFSKIRL